MKHALASFAFPWINRLGINALFEPFFGGVGSILTIHQVVPKLDRRIPHFGGEVSVDFLDSVLEYFANHRDFEVVSIDQLVADLKSKDQSSRKKIVFTFDDGYRDTYENAYPIFKKYRLPFTIYVTTDFANKKFVPWKDLLRDLVFTKDSISFLRAGTRHSFLTNTNEKRRAAFEEIKNHIVFSDPIGRKDLFDQIFDGRSVQETAHRVGIDWEHLKIFSTDSLVTVGAHTVTHPILKKLPNDQVLKELLDSKHEIETRLGSKALHFAYPYGGRPHVGEREFSLAAQVGFKSSVTTRVGNIFAEHAGHLMALPRIPISGVLAKVEMLNPLLSGTVPALLNRFHRVVTD